jgi:hypothetical protein
LNEKEIHRGGAERGDVSRDMGVLAHASDVWIKEKLGYPASSCFYIASTGEDARVTLKQLLRVSAPLR